MMEGVAGEDGVVLLDVELDVVQKVVALEETVTGGDVEIILMLGRLLRLGLDQDRALEADLVLVLDDEREEAAELIELALEIGVEQGLVALAPAPEHIVLAAEPVRHFERRADLARGIGEYLGVWIGRSARHVT